MSKRLIALLAGVFVVLLAVAGCGSSSDADEITTSSITKAQFIKQADAVCEKNEKQLQLGFGGFVKEKEEKDEEFQEPTEAQFAELMEAVVTPNLEREVEELRAIGAPEGDEDQIEAFVVAIEEGLEKAEGEPKLIVSNSEKLFGDSSQLAKEYGLKACAQR